MGLDYRVSLGAGFGRYFIDNHERQLGFALGLQFNRERNLADVQRDSVEGAVKLEFAAWKFDSPELDVKFSSNLSLAKSQFTPLQEGETNRDSAFATGTH